MPDNAFHSRLSGPAIFAAVWGRLRLRARRKGIRPRELSRVRSWLKTRYRLERPEPRDPLQNPRHYFPGLSAHAWHEPRSFHWIPRLEDGTATIRQELAALTGNGAFVPYRKDLARQGSWTTYMLWRFGRPERENTIRCPLTTSLIESLPVSRDAGLTYLSALAPGTRVAPHCGPTNTRLRVHLGLFVPDGCGIRVGQESRTWENGRAIVFDDSFEHEVWNEGDETRYVLILDIWHPELTAAETWAVAEVERASWYSWRPRRRKRASG